MTEPWKTSIEFTVTPTDDPDVVQVRQGGNVWPVRRHREDFSGGNLGPATVAARAYFEAHPPNPAHPLADAEEGEWWWVEWDDGSAFVERIDADSEYVTWPNVISARQVYVIPKVGADAQKDAWGKNRSYPRIAGWSEIQGLAL